MRREGTNGAPAGARRIQPQSHLYRRNAGRPAAPSTAPYTMPARVANKNRSPHRGQNTVQLDVLRLAIVVVAGNYFASARRASHRRLFRSQLASDRESTRGARVRRRPTTTATPSIDAVAPQRTNDRMSDEARRGGDQLISYPRIN